MFSTSFTRQLKQVVSMECRFSRVARRVKPTFCYAVWSNVLGQSTKPGGLVLAALQIAWTMPDNVLELMKLYSQPVRTQAGGVEYLPVPKQKEAIGRRA